ncbi:DUF4317 domain-containing protein [Qiania dongpingensis]|uniref:DUF4317 domain-containing protein n=1 Tax=Qiania dongpingensis TaxID=2763669 RepID=A0A7G9G5Q4_9FIRM|nr:DUF4317 domain-containing protein [Qiania dongpingensis]QNM06136.1 DUF4317 domain-containing protein [Qiania dongpingensis]
MNKKEISEIKKQFTPGNCAITRICGCYVDGEKEKKSEMREAFLSLPEEEMFKYFEIFRKNLSGTLGKNLINMEFPLSAESEGGTHDFLMKLRASRLSDDALLDLFYDKVIENYDYTGSFLILLIHNAYDIPGKSADGQEMFDASDEVYEYLICSICPVKLSKPGLCYNAEQGTIQNRVRDWLVELPDTGFLFPAFNERSSDIHSLLFYSKNADEFQARLVEEVLGCILPMPASSQKETFNSLIEETLGDDCNYESVKTIHEKLSEMVEEKKEEPEPLTLDKAEVRALLSQSGAAPERLHDFDSRYEEAAGSHAPILAANVINTRKFEIRTPDVIIQVSPDRADLVETRVVDGRQCLVIPMDEHVEVNGICVRPGAKDPAGNDPF